MPADDGYRHRREQLIRSIRTDPQLGKARENLEGVRAYIDEMVKEQSDDLEMRLEMRFCWSSLACQLGEKSDSLADKCRWLKNGIKQLEYIVNQSPPDSRVRAQALNYLSQASKYLIAVVMDDGNYGEIRRDELENYFIKITSDQTNAAIEDPDIWRWKAWWHYQILQNRDITVEDYYREMSLAAKAMKEYLQSEPQPKIYPQGCFLPVIEAAVDGEVVPDGKGVFGQNFHLIVGDVKVRNHHYDMDMVAAMLYLEWGRKEKGARYLQQAIGDMDRIIKELEDKAEAAYIRNLSTNNGEQLEPGGANLFRNFLTNNKKQLELRAANLYKELARETRSAPDSNDEEKTRKAREYYQEVIGINPRDQEALFVLARIASSRNEWEEASKQYRSVEYGTLVEHGLVPEYFYAWHRAASNKGECSQLSETTINQMLEQMPKEHQKQKNLAQFILNLHNTIEKNARLITTENRIAAFGFDPLEIKLGDKYNIGDNESEKRDGSSRLLEIIKEEIRDRRQAQNKEESSAKSWNKRMRRIFMRNVRSGHRILQ